MCTESFKGFWVNPDGFYLVKLPLSGMWAFIKYLIKPLVTTKTKCWVQFVFTPVMITRALQRYDIKLKGILK